MNWIHDMRTPITYYGGKQLLAKHIIPMIPKHKIYVEPYFGGGAVFFAKEKSKIEVINDINKKLINFYWHCQNNFDELKKLIDQTLHSELLFSFAKEIYKGKPTNGSLEEAWAVWIVTNMAFSGSPDGGWKWCNGTNGSNSAIYIANKRASFSKELHERLQHVQISAGLADDVIHKRDTENTFFYIDPPYINANQKHYSGFSITDLECLLLDLEKIKGKFILSNYPHPLIESFCRKNRWNSKIIEMNNKVANFNSPRKKQELLVWNY